MLHGSSLGRRHITRLMLSLLACGALASACVAQANAAVATAPVAWTPLAAQTDAAGNAAATVEQCVTTGEQTDRSATFSAEMTAVAGTARMAMRIEVQERLPGEELFHTVSAPGLGVWRGSASGVKIYQYVKQVTNLSFAGWLPCARPLPLAERQGLRDQARRTAHASVCATRVCTGHATGHAGPSRHARRLDHRELSVFHHHRLSCLATRLPPLANLMPPIELLDRPSSAVPCTC